MLRPGEALVFDWHRVAMCCAGAGEASLYARRRGGPQDAEGARPFEGRSAHLRGPRHLPAPRRSGGALDGKKTFGLRRFSSDLPDDFGLRAVMGYLPERTER